MGKVLSKNSGTGNFNIKKNMEPTVNANEVSRIAVGASIKGDFISHADVRVDGSVDGILFSEGRIVVGDSANLSGKLLCKNLDLWGRMDGDLYVQDTLTLKSSSTVNGKIFVNKIQMEMGAQLNGSCKMITPEEYETLVESNVKNPNPKPGKQQDKD